MCFVCLFIGHVYLPLVRWKSSRSELWLGKRLPAIRTAIEPHWRDDFGLLAKELTKLQHRMDAIQPFAELEPNAHAPIPIPRQHKMKISKSKQIRDETGDAKAYQMRLFQSFPYNIDFNLVLDIHFSWISTHSEKLLDSSVGTAHTNQLNLFLRLGFHSTILLFFSFFQCDIRYGFTQYVFSSLTNAFFNEIIFSKWISLVKIWNRS